METDGVPAFGSDRAGTGARAAEVVAFVRGRSVPCPRCGYELRDLETPRCPECGDELELRLASARPRFGWLLMSIAPGCFSGVAAVLLLIPIAGMTMLGGVWPPVPILGAECFGVLSAASVWWMYRKRMSVFALPTGRQKLLAAAIWGAHLLAFAAMLLGLFLWP